MDFNKSEKQKIFNELKGCVTEINLEEKYSNLTIKVGHQNHRTVNFVAQTEVFKKLIEGINLNDKICIKYYLSSVFKFNRYYTSATLLDITKLS